MKNRCCFYFNDTKYLSVMRNVISALEDFMCYFTMSKADNLSLNHTLLFFLASLSTKKHSLAYKEIH